MGEESKDGKRAQAEAKALLEQARAAFAAGNYREARAIDRRVIASSPNTPAAIGAQEQLDNLRLDPVTLYAGLATVALLVVAWVYALW